MSSKTFSTLKGYRRDPFVLLAVAVIVMTLVSAFWVETDSGPFEHRHNSDRSDVR